MPQQSTSQISPPLPSQAQSTGAPVQLQPVDLAKISGAGLIEAQQLPHGTW